MEKSLIINSIFIFIFIWGIALFFLWFRPKLEFFWKIMATLIFLFYIYFFNAEIMKGYVALKSAWYPVFLSFLKELLFLMYYTTFIFWPIVLVRSFFKSDDIGSEKLLRFMCVFTVIVWIGVIVYAYNEKTIDDFFFMKLIHSIPFIKK